MVLLEVIIFLLFLMLFPNALLFSAPSGAFLALLQLDHIFRDAWHLNLSKSALQETTSKSIYLHSLSLCHTQMEGGLNAELYTKLLTGLLPLLCDSQ